MTSSSITRWLCEAPGRVFRCYPQTLPTSRSVLIVAAIYENSVMVMHTSSPYSLEEAQHQLDAMLRAQYEAEEQEAVA